MPVNTGMIDDDEVEVSEASEPAVPPPSEVVTGLAPIAAEPKPDDDRPFVDVRNRRFHLRSAVPGMLLMDLADKQSKIRTTTTERDPNEPVDAATQKAQTALFAALGRSITFLVVEDERDEFTEFLISEEPPIEITELVAGENGGIVGRMMSAVSGRPTQSASG